MAALISGDKSLDLLSLHPFSMPQNNSLIHKVKENKVKENNAGVNSLRSVGKTEGVSNNNISSAISSKEDPRMFQDVPFLYPILPTTGYDVNMQNEYVYASDRMKADPNNSQRKRQRIVKSDTQPGLQPRLSKSQNLSSWLEKPNIDKDAYAKHATADPQTSLEGSKCDLPSTRQLFAKSSDAKFSYENLFAKSTNSTSEAQETFIGPSYSSKQSVSTDISKEDTEVKTNMNKKMLKLNSRGKLSSPPSKKITSTKELPNGTKRCSSPIKLIVVLKYGHKEETRRKFAEIVDKTPETCASLSELKHGDREVDSANQAKSDKSVHPFFSNRQKSKANVNADGNHKGLLERNMHHRDELQLMKRAVTPGKLRAQRQSCVEATGRIVGSTSLPNFSARHSVRSGGSCFSWPSKANLHVRGLENAVNVMPSPRYVDSSLFRENRKLKDSFVTVARSDDLMTRLSKDLCFHTSLNRTATAQDHIGWKPPTREVTTGPDLLKWFSQELLASEYATIRSTQRRGDTIDSEKITKHPALERMYSEIENTLTPFDEFACESILWASKYAPKTADQVLQPENRAQILRNWLRSLTIQATQNRKSLNIASNMINDRNSIPRRMRPKKRRKVDRLEGFITSSDEESSSREELIETTWDDSLAISTECDNKFTPVTSGCNNFSNAVLISGPHGCGKTAAVYAVAEELGFEIFEVNPGSRRTGRDLLDKVGEMAENHLVQPMTDPSDLSTTGTLGMEELHAAKTDTVGQQSMKSFFETKIRPTKSKDQVKVNHGARLCRSNGQVQRSAPRQQKQSLILLEEADVLFEKDKHFWPTVVSLLAYSKRPIVMTCTDERFIPHDLIRFQINLRFTPPPRDISIEYLMALTGKEGHKLSWETVSSIFDQTNQDLRSCIMNLNFWCQMGVGDRKGGLDWMINRWPAGVDLDKFGRKLRVVSNNTYRKEMSLISNELCFAKTSITFDRDCELLRDAFTNIRVDLELLYNIHGRGQSDWNSDSKQRPLQENRATYEQIIDAEIMSDVWSFADCFLEEQMDLASSFLPDKIRADAPEGVSILPVEPIENFTSFANHLAITSILLSRQLHPNNNDADPGSIDLPAYAAAKAAQNRCQEIVSNHGSSLTSALSPLAPDSTMYTVLTSHSQSTLASEVAPYIRAISTYDQELEVQRAYRLASFGGRLTRAARSVVEGVERGKVRRDKWIPGLNFIDVLQTAGPSWRQSYGIVKGGNEEEKEKDMDMQDFLGNRVDNSKPNEG